MSPLRGLRKLGRWLLLAVIRLFPVGKPAGAPVAVHSVLVVRTDERLGKHLLTTPLLGALRASFPSARVGLLCAASRAAAVAGTGLYDELWAFEKRDLFRRPWKFVALLLRLRRARYQVALDAGHSHAFSFTSAALVRWSGAGVRLGHARPGAERFLTDAVAKDPAMGYDAAAKLELLRPLVEPVGSANFGPAMVTGLGRGRAADELQRAGGRAAAGEPGGAQRATTAGRPDALPRRRGGSGREPGFRSGWRGGRRRRRSLRRPRRKRARGCSRRPTSRRWPRCFGPRAW